MQEVVGSIPIGSIRRDPPDPVVAGRWFQTFHICHFRSDETVWIRCWEVGELVVFPERGRFRVMIVTTWE